jgi:hypothetical protein
MHHLTRDLSAARSFHIFTTCGMQCARLVGYANPYFIKTPPLVLPCFRQLQSAKSSRNRREVPVCAFSTNLPNNALCKIGGILRLFHTPKKNTDRNSYNNPQPLCL